MCARLNVYTDYERGVKLWKKLGKLSTRELIRGADVPFTISLGELKVSRKLALCSTKVIKVAAHGRDAEQDGRLTEGNAAADEAARTATLSEPDASSAFVLPGPPFVLTLDGLPVYGDPRKAARQQIGSLRMERWRLLPTHGLYARLLPAAWGPSVRFNSSKLALASPPDGVTASFLIRWRLFCLRTPTQLARTEDSVAEFLDRDADGDATCPLCRSMRDGPAARGDTQHILLACPCLENTRQSVRQMVASVLRGIGSSGWWQPMGYARVTLQTALAGLHGLAPGDRDTGRCCSLLTSLPDVDNDELTDDWSAASVLASTTQDRVFYGVLPLADAKRLHERSLLVVCCVIPAGRWWKLLPANAPSAKSAESKPLPWQQRI